MSSRDYELASEAENMFCCKAKLKRRIKSADQRSTVIEKVQTLW